MKVQGEKKKSKLMKVCVDRTRSTINESMFERKKINLTSGSSGSSTCSATNENNLENAKVPAVVKKKRKSASNKIPLNVTQYCDRSQGSDSNESEPLL